MRGSLDESVHHLSAVVVAEDGRRIARTGDPDLFTFWRSASKPFQLLPLVEDGGVERFGIDDEMLALACGSHNAETAHRDVGARWLAAVGLDESQLSCGGHPSLWSTQAEMMIREGVVPTPLWSNCSGKHASLLALAKLHGWPTEGYEAIEHPVQERVAVGGCGAEWRSPAGIDLGRGWLHRRGGCAAAQWNGTRLRGARRWRDASPGDRSATR